MTAAMVLTAAGRAAVADAANVGLNAIQFRQLGIGSGLKPNGADDAAIAALRNSRDVADVAGDASIPGHVAFRADFDPSAAYSVTEAGLFARIGDAGQQFLFAYWAAEAVADAVAAALQDTALVVAGIVAIQSSEADITVTPSLTVEVGGETPDDATTAVKGLVRLATVAEHRAGASQALAATPKGAKALVDALKGSASSAGDTLGELERLIDAANRARNLLAARVTALEQDTGVADASTSAKGIVELATVAEHRTGASERLAATPKGAKALVDALKGSASSAGDTLGELEALITALAARITALEDRPMGQETLIFISDAGVNVAVGAPGVDFDLTADLDDYDAIYFLGTSPAGNANNAVQTEMVPTSEITANSNVAAQGINGTAAVIKLNKEAARRINLRGTNGQFEAVNMIVGVKFARP